MLARTSISKAIATCVLYKSITSEEPIKVSESFRNFHRQSAIMRDTFGETILLNNNLMLLTTTVFPRINKYQLASAGTFIASLQTEEVNCVQAVQRLLTRSL